MAVATAEDVAATWDVAVAGVVVAVVGPTIKSAGTASSDFDEIDSKEISPYIELRKPKLSLNLMSTSTRSPPNCTSGPTVKSAQYTSVEESTTDEGKNSCEGESTTGKSDKTEPASTMEPRPETLGYFMEALDNDCHIESPSF